MTLKITIEMNNAAFEDGAKHDEAARILRDAADKIEAGAWALSLRDINGNKVGTAKVVGDEKHHDNKPAIADWNRRNPNDRIKG